MKIKMVTKEYPITILENKDNFVAASLRILATPKNINEKRKQGDIQNHKLAP